MTPHVRTDTKTLINSAGLQVWQCGNIQHRAIIGQNDSTGGFPILFKILCNPIDINSRPTVAAIVNKNNMVPLPVVEFALRFDKCGSRPRTISVTNAGLDFASSMQAYEIS